MFKRLFWLLVGVALGFGASVWFTRAVKRTLRRLSPPVVGESLVKRVKRTAGDLRVAVAEGRDAMQQREASLRAELASNARGARLARSPSSAA
jgi:hypothetical protein